MAKKLQEKISYILQFIDSTIFMACSLSNLVNNLDEGIHRIKCKCVYDGKNSRIKYMYCNCFLEYRNFKDDLIKFKCLCCNKNCQHKFDEKLKEQFFNT